MSNMFYYLIGVICLCYMFVIVYTTILVIFISFKKLPNGEYKSKEMCNEEIHNTLERCSRVIIRCFLWSTFHLRTLSKELFQYGKSYWEELDANSRYPLKVILGLDEKRMITPNSFKKELKDVFDIFDTWWLNGYVSPKYSHVTIYSIKVSLNNIDIKKELNELIERTTSRVQEHLSDNYVLHDRPEKYVVIKYDLKSNYLYLVIAQDPLGFCFIEKKSAQQDNVIDLKMEEAYHE